MSNTFNIETFSLKSMCLLFNNVTGESVKKFSDAKSGLKRTAQALVESGKAVAAPTGTSKFVFQPAPGYRFDEAKMTLTKGKGTAAKSRKPAGERNGDISPARGKRLGIGAFMADQIRAGKETQEVLDAVKKKFPDSRATGADVSIVRRKVKDGLL